MARPAAKRKAEEPLDSKQKDVFGKGTKDGTRRIINYAQEDDVFGQQSEESSVSPERDRKLEEDRGRVRFQQVLRKSRKSTQKKASTKGTNKFLTDFEDTVQEKAQNFKDKLLQVESNLVEHEEKHLQTLSAAYFSVLTGTKPNEQPPESGHDKPSSKLYQMSKLVLQQAHELLHEFDESTEAIAAVHKSLGSDQAWEKEVEDVRRVIHLGKDVGKARLAALLDQSRSSERSGNDDAISDHFYGKGNGGVAEMNWGLIARNQERAVRRLAGTLPRE